MTCLGISYDQLGRCGEKPTQCVICTGEHKSENHTCKLIGYPTKKGKIGIHVVPKCANCGRNYQAIAFRYPTKQKAQAVVWKNKTKKIQDREEKTSSNEIHEDKETLIETQKDREVTPDQVKMKLDSHNNWQEALENNPQILAL